MQRCCAGLGVALTVAFGAGRARGAEVRVQAPDGCVDTSQIVEQVGVVLGRPLASVADVDFVVEIAAAARQGWHLRLDMTEKRAGATTAPTRSRELTARTCTELADAAAVAIAMSVRSLTEEGGGVPSPPPVSAADPPRATPAAVAVRSVPAAAAGPDQRRLGVGVTFAALSDAGALPGADIGVELGAAFRFSYLRLAARGTLFAPREKRLADGSGGEFTLAFVTMLGCLQRTLGQPSLFGCAGFELGRLSGQGLGVSRSRLGAATWEAITAEIGVAFPVSGPLAAVLRGAAAVPLQRPEFVIDPTISVHQPSRLDGRAALGLEYFF